MPSTLLDEFDKKAQLANHMIRERTNLHDKEHGGGRRNGESEKVDSRKGKKCYIFGQLECHRASCSSCSKIWKNSHSLPIQCHLGRASRTHSCKKENYCFSDRIVARQNWFLNSPSEQGDPILFDFPSQAAKPNVRVPNLWFFAGVRSPYLARHTHLKTLNIFDQPKS